MEGGQQSTGAAGEVQAGRTTSSGPTGVAHTAQGRRTNGSAAQQHAAQRPTPHAPWTHIPPVQRHVDALVVDGGPRAHAAVGAADHVRVGQLNGERAGDGEARVVRADVVGHHGHDAICSAGVQVGVSKTELAVRLLRTI